jgi:hypothetical protein
VISLTPHRKRRRGRAVDDLECNLQISHVTQRSHREVRRVDASRRVSTSLKDSVILHPKNIDEIP